MSAKVWGDEMVFLRAPSSRYVMKYLALLFALVFLLFAGWQYNDPDPLLWGAVYLIAAYVSFRAFQGRFNREMLVVLLVWSAAWAVSSWSQMTSYEGFFTQGEGIAMKTPNQELAREASGLGVVAMVYALFLVVSRRSIVASKKY